jgi:hypothetical protein
MTECKKLDSFTLTWQCYQISNLRNAISYTDTLGLIGRKAQNTVGMAIKELKSTCHPRRCLILF